MQKSICFSLIKCHNELYLMEMRKNKKVKITVLKTTLDEELASEYGAIGLTSCPMLKAGQIFYGDYSKPEGFCDEAWKAIYQYLFALSHGGGNDLFYYGDWIKKAWRCHLQL